MRAVVLRSAGDLHIETRDAPHAEPGLVRVRVAAGGICGSDLHYYQHGGFGTVRMQEPMILGHEVAGRVLEAPEAADIAPGDAVAVSPSRPCHDCQCCRAGMENHCENMRFYGSAMRVPHIQGAFRDELLVRPDQCFRVDPSVPLEHAAFAEPLAVALHALNRSGPVAGKRVLITGCGPIGALVLLAAKAAGAAEIVVTDVIGAVLDRAQALGATRVIDVGREAGWTADYSAGKGHFDLMFEASGVEAALRDGIEVLRPRATLVQLGLGGEVRLPWNVIVAKELQVHGSFRFHAEFGDAVAAINSGRIDVGALLTARYPVEEADAAFRAAGDRSISMKVQLDFTT